MIRYKLTDEHMQTYGGCQWKLGETKTTSGEGELCGPGWLHCYDSPELAVLLNPIHADFPKPRLFKCRVGGAEKTDCGLKAGYTEMTLLEEIELPVFSLEQRIYFAILCAKQVYNNVEWNAWADSWISGEDRSSEAAMAAEWAAMAAEWAARAAARAARAARAAAWAAAEAATIHKICLKSLAKKAYEWRG